MSSSAPDDRSAGASPAVAGATRPRFGEITIRGRGRLPHWERDNATYFVTFRLADSLPRTVLDRIASERASILQLARQQSRELIASEQQHLKRLSSVRIEQYLDCGTGSCSLRMAQIATLVADTLQLFDEKKYRVFAWCVMPNHVHAIVRVFPTHTLAEVLHSWKSYTAKEANRILKSHGAFWQREYYDHLLRDEVEFERAIKYVVENPGKAGLKDWEWLWVRGQGARATAGKGAGATVEIAAGDSKL
jgi:REP element-mobilizing transposase RayT